MSSQETFAYHRQQLADFAEILPEALALIIHEDQQQELTTNLKIACENLDADMANGWHLAQDWFFSFIGNHPQFTPLIPRDLLWFLGADCMHFLTDEEITRFQNIEETMAEQGVSWLTACERQSWNQQQSSEQQ